MNKENQRELADTGSAEKWPLKRDDNDVIMLMMSVKEQIISKHTQVLFFQLAQSADWNLPVQVQFRSMYYNNYDDLIQHTSGISSSNINT